MVAAEAGETHKRLLDENRRKDRLLLARSSQRLIAIPIRGWNYNRLVDARCYSRTAAGAGSAPWPDRVDRISGNATHPPTTITSQHPACTLHTKTVTNRCAPPPRGTVPSIFPPAPARSFVLFPSIPHCVCDKTADTKHEPSSSNSPSKYLRSGAGEPGRTWNRPGRWHIRSSTPRVRRKENPAYRGGAGGFVTNGGRGGGGDFPA